MTLFVDTNVFVYARDASEGEKQRRAQEWLDYLWRSRTGRLSMQILHEFYVTVTQKLVPGMSPTEARADVRDLCTWRPVELDARLLEAAWRVHDDFETSFWDSLVLAAAERAGCEELLSEDFQDGREYRGTRVVNPFLRDPPTS